ncbi:MAG: phasin family protein [Paracoccaceae bacterium]
MTEPSNKPRSSTSSAAFAPMQETALKAWVDMGMQALQFASSGLQKCVEAQTAMMACKTLEDFQKVQTEFYSSALEDYRAQVARMMGSMSATKGGGLGEKAPKMKRGYDDVPI